MFLYPSKINEAKLYFEIDQFVKQAVGINFGTFNHEAYLYNLETQYRDLKANQELEETNYQLATTLIVFEKWLEYRYQKPSTPSYNLTESEYQEFVSLAMPYTSQIYKEQLQWQNQEIKNRKSLEQYVTSLIHHYARLLFVRVDLGYLKDAQNDVTIAKMNEHMKLFLSRVRNKDTCFRDLQGYAWAIEQGETRGYHCHLLLIYDGTKHQKDYYLANEIGRTWQAITGGLGSFFNCNNTEYKERYESLGKLGIGMICRGDEHSMTNAINTASYLVNPEKDDQTLLASLPNMRTFGKGQYNVGWRRGIRP